MLYFSTENQFEDYIQKLRQAYQENPNRALKEVHRSVKRLSRTKEPIITDENRNIILIVIYFIVIALIGLINYTSMPLYLFGIIFYATGLLIGLFTEKSGLVFLFSHGMTGLGLMIGSELGGLLTSPFITDAPIYIYVLLCCIVLLVLLGIMSAVLYSLSDAIKDKEYSVYIPYILFGMAIILSIIVAKIVFVQYGIQSLNFS
jgi:hypothetical protein